MSIGYQLAILGAQNDAFGMVQSAFQFSFQSLIRDAASSELGDLGINAGLVLVPTPQSGCYMLRWAGQRASGNPAVAPIPVPGYGLVGRAVLPDDTQRAPVSFPCPGCHSFERT